MMTLHMASATARSVPGLIGIHSLDFAAVFDSLTSNVTMRTLRSTKASISRCATAVWFVWASKQLDPKFSTNRVLSKSQLS